MPVLCTVKIKSVKNNHYGSKLKDFDVEKMLIVEANIGARGAKRIRSWFRSLNSEPPTPLEVLSDIQKNDTTQNDNQQSTS
jgi:hypothetical protein